MEPELLQPSSILIRARHNDEKLHGGDEHEHAIGVPLTKDGRYNGGKMLNHMKNNFNTNSARHMRERGWDMEDLDLYDPSREDDEEYMAERREKRRKQGRSVNDYAADQAEERASKTKEIEAEAQRSARKTRRQARMDTDKTMDVTERDADSIRDEADRYKKQRRADADRYAKEQARSWSSTMEQEVMYRNMMTDSAEKMWEFVREAISTGSVAK